MGVLYTILFIFILVSQLKLRQKGTILLMLNLVLESRNINVKEKSAMVREDEKTNWRLCKAYNLGYFSDVEVK